MLSRHTVRHAQAAFLGAQTANGLDSQNSVQKDMNMLPQTLAHRARLMVPMLMMSLAMLACSLGGQQLEATATVAGTSASTLVALSDVPDVEIRSPQNNSEVVI